MLRKLPWRNKTYRSGSWQYPSVSSKGIAPNSHRSRNEFFFSYFVWYLSASVYYYYYILNKYIYLLPPPTWP